MKDVVDSFGVFGRIGDGHGGTQGRKARPNLADPDPN